MSWLWFSLPIVSRLWNVSPLSSALHEAIVGTRLLPSRSCLKDNPINWVTQSSHWPLPYILMITLLQRSTTGWLLFIHIESPCTSVGCGWVIAIILFIRVSPPPQHWDHVPSVLSKPYWAAPLPDGITVLVTFLWPSLSTYWACTPEFPSTWSLLLPRVCIIRPLTLADIPSLLAHLSHILFRACASWDVCTAWLQWEVILPSDVAAYRKWALLPHNSPWLLMFLRNEDELVFQVEDPGIVWLETSLHHLDTHLLSVLLLLVVLLCSQRLILLEGHSMCFFLLVLF